MTLQNVMKFAEMSQEVQVAIPTPYKKLDLGLTPGRRRANQVSLFINKVYMF